MTFPLRADQLTPSLSHGRVLMKPEHSREISLSFWGVTTKSNFALHLACAPHSPYLQEIQKWKTYLLFIYTATFTKYNEVENPVCRWGMQQAKHVRNEALGHYLSMVCVCMWDREKNTVHVCAWNLCTLSHEFSLTRIDQSCRPGVLTSFLSQAISALSKWVTANYRYYRVLCFWPSLAQS